MKRLLALALVSIALLGAVWLARRELGAAPATREPERAAETAPTAELATPAQVTPLARALVEEPAARAPVAPQTTPTPDEPHAAPRAPDPTLPRSSLAGRVVHADGTPAADADVEVARASSGATVSPLARTHTLPDGTFALECVGTGPFWLRARTAEEEGRTDADVEGGRTDVEIVLLPALHAELARRADDALVRGTVVDPRAAPVAGAAVTAHGEAPDAMPFHPGRTDADGRFELRGPAADALRVLAGADGFASSEPALVAVAPGETAEVALELRDPARVTGIVLGRGGRPLADVRISAGPLVQAGAWTSSSIWSGDASATTDAGGRFELVVMPGRTNISASAPESELREIAGARDPSLPAGACCERAVTLGPGESAHVELALDAPPVRLQGRVELGGRAPERARVQFRALGLTGLSSATYADGEYEARLPGPGTYELWVTADGTNCQLPVDVPEGEQHRFDVSLSLARVEGHVRDELGSPLAAVTVDAMSHGAAQVFRSSGRAVSGADGAYALELSPGTYRLSPRVEFEEQRSFLECEDRIVTLVEGTTQRADFELRSANELTGVVRLPGGAPAAGAWVVLGAPWAPSELVERADEHGRFRFASLGAGRQWLEAAAAEGDACFVSREPLAVDVRPGAPAHELELVPATRLRVRLPAPKRHGSGRSDAIDPSGRVHRMLARDKDPATREELHDYALVPPGPFLIRALCDGASLERAISLDGAGGIHELDLRPR